MFEAEINKWHSMMIKVCTSFIQIYLCNVFLMGAIVWGGGVVSWSFLSHMSTEIASFFFACLLMYIFYVSGIDLK